MPNNWRLMEAIRLLYEHLTEEKPPPLPPKEPPKLVLIICKPELEEVGEEEDEG
jgi:hypothetical protein